MDNISTKIKDGEVTSITVTSTGSGYTVPPKKPLIEDLQAIGEAIRDKINEQPAEA